MRRIIPLLFAAASLWACSPATLTADDTPVSGVPDPGTPPTQSGPDIPPPPGTTPDDPDPETTPPTPEVAPMRIVIDQPPRAHRQSPGAVQIVGRVVDGPAATLTVGGMAVVPDAQGYFSTELPAETGLLPIVTEAVAADGRLAEDRRAVLVGADADPGAEVTRAMQIMVSAEGIAQINTLLDGFVDTLDITSLVAGQDSGDFTLENVQYDDVSIALVPRNGYLEVRLTIHGLRLEMSGTVNVVFDIDVEGSMNCNALYIDARLNLAPTPAGGLDLALTDPSIQFEGFGFNIGGVPGFIEDLFEGTVRGMAEDAIRDALTGTVIPQLFDPSALDQVIDVNGRNVLMGLKIRGTEVTYDGLMLTMGSTARAEAPVHQGNALPIDMTAAQMSTNDPMDIAMSADLIGRILHALWASAALDLEMAPGGQIDLPASAGLPLLYNSLGEAVDGIDIGAPLTIRTRALLPPVAYVDAGERPLVIEIGEMMFDLSVPEGPLATVAVHLIIRMRLDLDTSGGGIAFVPDMEIESYADVADMPRGQVKERELERQIALAVRLIPAALADQAFSLGADALPVPLLLENSRFEADPAAPWVHVRAGISVPVAGP